MPGTCEGPKWMGMESNSHVEEMEKGAEEWAQYGKESGSTW